VWTVLPPFLSLAPEVKMTYKLILIKIDHRSNDAAKVQEILTKYGCSIKVRLGLHETSKEMCANDGLIVLKVEDEKATLENIVTELNKIEFVQAQLIEM
jgi:hypothetical protein